MSINTTITPLTEDLYFGGHDRKIAELAAEHGFPVAGFVGEIYEDAVILIGPMFKFEWTPEKVNIGRVISIFNKDYNDNSGHFVQNFVLLTFDGTQVPMSYGSSYSCFFALPEDSEGQIMLEGNVEKMEAEGNPMWAYLWAKAQREAAKRTRVEFGGMTADYENRTLEIG